MKHLFHAGKWMLADLISTLFFVGLYALTHNVLVATALAMAVGVGQILWLKLRRRPVDAMQWLMLGLVLVFGGASLLTHDSRFIMFKPTLIYLAVAAVMLRPGWMNRYLPPIVLDNAPDLGVTFGYVWAGMMTLTALANAVIAATLPTEVWAAFVAVVPLVSKLVLFALQYTVMRLVTPRRIAARREALAMASPP